MKTSPTGSGCEEICDECFSAYVREGSRFCSDACAAANTITTTIPAASLVATARELASKATPGPWVAFRHDIGSLGEVVGVSVEGDVPDAEIVRSPYFVEVDPDPLCVLTNAAFIAASRTLVPLLCDALEAAEKERDTLRLRHASVSEGLDAAIRVAASQDARIARLEATLAVLNKERPT